MTDDKAAEQPGTPESTPALEPTRLGPEQDWIGMTLNNRFVIQSELKRGGMGVVYLAVDQQLHGRTVVVKALLDAAYQSEYVVQKFRQEVEALSRIDHPGIVGVIDAGQLPNGKPFIVMQYVDGVTLRSVMKPEGMPLERVADLMKQIGKALTAAHDKGIFHRDLKPDNIMIKDLGHGEEQVKIIDFGVAKVKDSVVAQSTTLNLSPGTVSYMAPEQLSDRPVTAATDVFAMGTIAYEMITGRKPFNPETAFELLQMQQAGVRIKPKDLRPGLDLHAQDAVLKALGYQPSDRYMRPIDFGNDLASAITSGSSLTGSAASNPSQLPETRLSTEETPVAQNPTPALPGTIATPYNAVSGGSPINPSATQLGLKGAAASGTSGRKLMGGVLILGVLAVSVIGAIAWYVWHSRNTKKESASPESSQRFLSYGLTVQKMRAGRPYQDQFDSSGQEIFENGWKFRMRLTSEQAGFLYLLNEGPAAGGEDTLNLLFPAPSTNNGSPQLASNQEIQTGWMVFDEHQGTEKFWIVWAEKAVPELEAVKGVVNPKDKGTIGDARQVKDVRDFLAKYSGNKPEVEKSKTKKETDLKGKGDVLVHLLELEHH